MRKAKQITRYQIKNADCFSAADAVHTIEWIANFDWLTVPKNSGKTWGESLNFMLKHKHFDAKSTEAGVINIEKPGSD